MTGRTRPHYGFRVAQGMIPTVEITEHKWVTVPDERITGTRTERAEQVVKVKFGLTVSHAINRALKWMHKNGDPR